VSREFSLFMLYKRMLSQQGRQVASDSVGYINDAYGEDRKSVHSKTLKELREAHKECSNWSGVDGKYNAPVDSDYQSLMQEKNVFTYFGYEPFLGACSQRKVATMHCEGLSLAVLCDQAVNEVSHRRRAKLVNRLRCVDISLQRPYYSALLLSVRGVNSVVLRTHAVAAQASADMFNTFWRCLLTGMAVGQAARLTSMEPEARAAVAPHVEIALNKKAYTGRRSSRRSSPRRIRPSSRNTKRGGSSHTTARDSQRSEADAAMIALSYRSVQSNDSIAIVPHRLRSYDRYNAILVGLPDTHFD
jgi:hypothetical protein